jgi:cell division septum initiation protein DivIVA
MPEAIAPVPISDETTRRLFGEPSFRVAKRGGYDPGDVAEFLGGLGSQMINLIGRLRKAESDVEVLRTETSHWQARAREAEATRETFERTLALAEDTANAAVADARARAAGILTTAEANADELVGQARHQAYRMVEQARHEAQRSYAEERLKVVEEWQRVQNEAASLETLRLAVAAEAMALEEVRNQLRARIRMAATQMLEVAESSDCLGQSVARVLPDRPHPIEAPAPAAVETGSVPIAAATPTAPEAVALPVEAEEILAPALDPVIGFGDAEADAAFERFMSEDIEDEPSRLWLVDDDEVEVVAELGEDDALEVEIEPELEEVTEVVVDVEVETEIEVAEVSTPV